MIGGWVRRSMSFDVQAVQKDLKAANLDGWLFYDFRGRDPIALRILQLPSGMRTRRWFYFVPTKGQPRKLVHKIESESLAALPGETLYYAGQGELQQNLQELVGAREQMFVVTAVPDEKKGERLIVLHTVSEEQLEACLTRLGKSDLPALWRPRRDQFVRLEKLPYLGTGKLDLRKARELAQETSRVPSE